MHPALPVIHMFWHGPALTRMERLCIASFRAHDHPVQLHVYDEPAGVPAGIDLVDAERTLPRRLMFRDKRFGSLAPFADWFRYRLLHEHGGIWADTDVVCLKPLAYPGEEIYSWMDETAINNAVLGLPAGHRLAAWMADCCEQPNRFLPYDNARAKRRKLKRRFLQGNGRGNLKWGEYGPDGLTQAVRHFGDAAKALPFWHFFPIHYRNWHTVFDGSLADNPAILGESRALHLWNEMTRRSPGFDKNARFPADSLFEQLCARYLTSDS